MDNIPQQVSISASTEARNYTKPFITVTFLFFMWGFITVMNDILINTFKGIFDLSAPQRALVQFSFFGAFFVISLLYFIISSTKGKDPINNIGYKNGMAISLLVCGIGCISFYPAAMLHSYTAFLIALFILASGVTFLQICANPYAAILGNPEGASSRLNLAQGFNSLGTTIGPIVGIILIYQVFSSGELTVDSVANTYLVYGAVFILFSFLVSMSKMPAFKNEETIEPGLSVLKQRHLTLGIIAIAFYVGSEVAVGSWIVEFLKEEHIGGLQEAEASYFLSYFWGGLMMGRLIASTSLNSDIPKYQKLIRMIVTAIGVFFLIYIATAIKYEDGAFAFLPLEFSYISLYLILIVIAFLAFTVTFNNPAKTLVVFSSINAALLLIAITTSGKLAFWSIIGTGLFFSIGWSNIFSLAIKGLGKFTSQGSALLVMAIVGGAILPSIQSFIIESANVQLSFIVPLLGMVYLIFYGLKGHQVVKPQL